MEKLDAIVALCCNVSFDAGENRLGYEEPEEYVEDWFDNVNEPVDQDVMASVKARNNVVRLWIYPRTPVGHYRAIGATYSAVIDQLLPAVLEDIDYTIASGEPAKWWVDANYTVEAYQLLGGTKVDELKACLSK